MNYSLTIKSSDFLILRSESTTFSALIKSREFLPNVNLEKETIQTKCLYI